MESIILTNLIIRLYHDGMIDFVYNNYSITLFFNTNKNKKFKDTYDLLSNESRTEQEIFRILNNNIHLTSVYYFNSNEKICNLNMDYKHKKINYVLN